MIRAIIKQLLMAAPTVLLVALVAFSVLVLSPGDVASVALRSRTPLGGISEATIRQFSARHGLDLPFLTQFGIWLGNIVHGDFGQSLLTGQPVLREFTLRIGCTLWLALFGSLLAFLFGIGGGLICALCRNRWPDKVLLGLSSLNMSVPSFWLALILLWLFSLKLRIVPAFGFRKLSDLFVPALSLGISSSSSLLQVTRASVLEALNSSWTFTLRGKGLSERTIMIKHILKNIAIPVLTLGIGDFIMMLGGSTLIENIYGLPGVGAYLVKSIPSKDIPVVSGFLFLLGLIIVLANLALEISWLIIDPRLRGGKS
jgi:peptide/nickel transport system permease protein